MFVVFGLSQTKPQSNSTQGKAIKCKCLVLFKMIHLAQACQAGLPGVLVAGGGPARGRCHIHCGLLGARPSHRHHMAFLQNILLIPTNELKDQKLSCLFAV